VESTLTQLADFITDDLNLDYSSNQAQASGKLRYAKLKG